MQLLSPIISRSLAVIFLIFTTACAFPNTATTPAIRPDYSAEQRANWLKRHEEFVAIARQGGVNVLFIGDSITDYWRSHGKEVWEKYFAKLGSANFGISGDRTQQVLWRITNGELDGIRPKVVVLLIGTNNTDAGLGENSLTPRNTTPEIVAGVGAIVKTIRVKSPASKIILLGVFPRGEKNTPIRRQLAEINAGLAQLDDGRHVKFLDIGVKFLAPDDSPSSAMMPDLLHLTDEGYKIWGAALQEPLTTLLR